MKNSIKWLNQFRLLMLDEVDSTNLEAKRIAATNNACSYLVICTKTQTAGRGKYGRKWESINGNLFFSIILPRTASLEVMTQLCFVSGVAVEAAVASACQSHDKNLSIKLKWPNDILLNNKKTAGILIETAGKDNEYVIVGIGVNIVKSPILNDYPTTSLHEEGLNSITAIELLHEIMEKFIKYYQIWLAEDFLPIRSSWLKKAKGIGEIINVTTGDSVVSGELVDIDFHGALRIKLANGNINSINTGEVFF